MKTRQADLGHRKRRVVVFAAYDGVSLLDLAGPLETFCVASAFGGSHDSAMGYECHVVSARGGLVRTADGVRLATVSPRSLNRTPIDTLIVPGAFGVDDVTRDRQLVDWVRRRAARCGRVCSVCVGSFLLADAGLLDGRRAATHWLHASLLSERHPLVRVEPDAIFVRDGRVWSSAGVTAGIDLALALIEHDSGRDLAVRVARILVVYLKRAGGQSQHSALLAAQGETESDEFHALERWIAEHLNEDLTVETLARKQNMSPRNFARVFAQKRGRTPAKAVEAIRVDAARRRLEETSERIEAIARSCGFGNEERLRLAFARTLGITPRDYRKRFSSTVLTHGVADRPFN
jgi:transcriptional regulator GlxA family with amidase domain